jgi:beta-galactosidase
MFLFGIVMALFGAILPTLRAELGIDLAQAGGLFLVMNACILATSLGLGPLVDRFGMKPPLVVGPVVEGLGLAAVASAHNYTALAWGALLLGLGGGALNSSTNALVADLHDSPEARSAALNLLGVFFGIGAVLIPLATGLLLEAASLEAILLAAALVCLLVAVHNALVPLPPPKQAEHPPLARILALAREPLVLAFAALLFFQSGNEFVAGGFVSSFLVREIGITVEAAAWTVAGYWGALMLARLVLSRIALRLDGRRLLVGCALATAASVALLAVSRQPRVAVAASLALGAALAGIFPTTFGIVAARHPRSTGTVFGLLLAAALSGGMLLPWVAGQVGEAHGLRPALLVVAAQSLAVAALAALSSRARAGVAGLLLVALAAESGAQSARPSEPVFPMAVWYGGGKARAPMLEPDPRAKKEEWRRDLKQIRALGFNTVRCWLDWASGEPSRGGYRFDTLDVLLELAEAEGLKVVVQVYMDSAPEWVGRENADALFVSSNGQAIRPESSPGYCLDHRRVREADHAFYEAVARRAAASPAFLGFDLWSEPHVINWANPTYIQNPEFCFCRHTVARFRDWLKKKYGTLEALNAAWYRRYASWDEVEPNRLSTILSYTDYIDWKSFIAAKLGEDLRARYLAAKRGAPDRVATSHAAGVGLFSSPHYWEGQSDDWTMAAQVDYYGTSFYPKHSAFVDRDTEWRAALLDFARSFGYAGGRGGFWIGELQAGFGTIALNVSPTVTPEDLRIWTWSALARGAKAIATYAYYPMSTGYESGGFGLVQLDGTPTERAKTAGAIARLVGSRSALFLGARPVPAQVAVVYNPLSHFVGGRQRAAAYGGPQGEVAGIERDSLLGVYRALFPSNVPLDFVHADHLKAAELAAYRLVVLPYPLMLRASAAAELREYVRAGGALVLEARAGWNDESGRAAPVIPGLGLAEVVGAREADVQTVEKGKAALVAAEGMPGLAPGERLPGRWYEESLEPTAGGARVLARFASGAPAAVASSFGRGKALMLGSYVSAGYVSEPAETARRFYEGLLDWAGVTRTVAVTGDPLEVRLLSSGREHLVFVFNHAAVSAAATIRLRVPLAGRSPYELVSGRPLPVTPISEGFEWRESLPAREVRMLVIGEDRARARGAR